MVVLGSTLALLLVSQMPIESLRPRSSCFAGPEARVSSFGEALDHCGHGESPPPKVYVLADDAVAIAFRRWKGPLTRAIRRDGAMQETRAIPVRELQPSLRRLVRRVWDR